MNEDNNLDYITNFLSETSDRIEKIHKKVKHGKLKVQRKKIKAQVLKGSTPRDYKRELICKNARKKAHTSVADSKRNISNNVRDGLASTNEGLKLVNPGAFTLSEAYGLDFMEEAAGYDINIEFFEKPTATPITEGLVVGKTPKGRDRKCKAIGIAEGVFAPIRDAEGNSVFSRNHRLYESDHWDYQLENQNLVDRVATRRMLGTIGHYDKKVDDKDLAEGKVSHIVTDLEIREDEENGRYLWGRLEIINTEAGRRLKEYYDNGIPLFVSSRGGGKLLDVPGKDYRVVDKTKYFCETFDVVKEPGFLEACPHYHNEEKSSDINSITKEVVEKISLQLGKEISEILSNVSEGVDNSNEIDEDNNMKDIDCNVTATDNIEEILKKLVKPLAEGIQELTDTVEKIKTDIYESEEAPVEEPAKEAEEVAEPEAEVEAVKEEAEPEKAAEEPAVEPEAEEAPAEKVEEPAEEVKPVEEAKEDDKEEKADDKEAEKEEKADDKEAKEDDKEEKAEPVKEEAEVVEEPAKEVEAEKEEAPAEAEVVEEAKEDDKEEKADDKEDKKEEEAKEEKADDKEAEKEEKAEPVKEELEAEEIKEEAETDEVPAGMQQVIDYKAMYEGLDAEVKEATQTITEMIETFKDFGKRYLEVVTEAKEKEEKLQEQLDAANKTLNSYKLVEKFNITVEKANEMLGSKSYEAVEEELKEAEATKLQEEAQAKVEQVSESIKPDVKPTEAPVSKKRKAYSAFSAETKENVSESVEETHHRRKAFSWFG